MFAKCVSKNRKNHSKANESYWEAKVDEAPSPLEIELPNPKDVGQRTREASFITMSSCNPIVDAELASKVRLILITL